MTETNKDRCEMTGDAAADNAARAQSAAQSHTHGARVNQPAPIIVKRGSDQQGRFEIQTSVPQFPDSLLDVVRDFSVEADVR